MKILITCGPAHAPIDEVRRITNFSTGEIGVLLANAFAAAGHEVVCLKGEAATTPLQTANDVNLRSFTTNDDLARQLAAIGNADAVFHTAALCDYEVDEVRDAEGRLQSEAKIPSRAGGLVIHLKPARKVLPALRGQFPGARIVGWKYELNGAREDALAAGRRQLAEARVNLCVVNGAAYGAGFGLLSPDDRLEHVADKQALCAALVRWCEGSAGASGPGRPKQ
jgi:phosphopantothenoylcysteine decarboxylase/phosphopantothenate--cysteine ligase